MRGIRSRRDARTVGKGITVDSSCRYVPRKKDHKHLSVIKAGTESKILTCKWLSVKTLKIKGLLAFGTFGRLETRVTSYFGDVQCRISYDQSTRSGAVIVPILPE